MAETWLRTVFSDSTSLPWTRPDYMGAELGFFNPPGWHDMGWQLGGGGHLDVAVYRSAPVCRLQRLGGLPQCRHRHDLRPFTLAGHGVRRRAGLSIWLQG